MTIDVGTGDGRAVLAVASREPTTLALGLDANAAAMAEASRRAAAPAKRGGLPNAAFVVAAAEAIPAELAGVADLVTVRFPWGSLLRGVVGGDDVAAAGVATLARPDGAIELVLAPSARDGLDGVPTCVGDVASAVSRAFGAHGFEIIEARAMTPPEVAATGSTWARRLGPASRNGAGSDRIAMLVRLLRR